MIEMLERHLEAMRGLVVSLEPETVAPEDARRLLELGSAVERLGQGLKVSMTQRALVDAPWGMEGYRSESAWLAEQMRSSVPQAIALKQSAERLEKLPATADAARAGALSAAEIQAITAAATADPSLEEELLEAASSMPVHELFRCARIQGQAANDRDPEHRRRLTESRYFNSWTDAEGMLRLSAALLMEDGMEVVGRVRQFAQHLESETRRTGETPPPEKALAADALVGLVRGDQRWATFHGPRAVISPRADIVLHAHLESLRRGRLEDGEICEVPGVGPVPLDVLESLVGDANAQLVVEDGVNVLSVTNLGRLVHGPQRVALEARDPRCVVPNCTVELGLEIDHWQIPFAQGGPTELWNLCRICKTHHRMKTYDGYVLAGGPGKWEWRPPG